MRESFFHGFFKTSAQRSLFPLLSASRKIIFVSLETYSCNATPTCRCISVAHWLHFRATRSRHLHAEKPMGKISRKKSSENRTRLSHSSELTREAERKQSLEPKSAADDAREVAKSLAWTATTILCFDSIHPAFLHSPPAGMALCIPQRDCRSSKFIYFSPFDVFYSFSDCLDLDDRDFDAREFRKSTA